MSYTYLELVNNVLRRLREKEVSAVTDNAYSKLIGDFVNDAKRMVEDSYNWNALNNTISTTTSSGVYNYTLTDSGQRFRVADVINDTSNNFLDVKSSVEMDKLFLIDTPESGYPQYYNFNGVDSNGDTKVDLYPIPDSSYIIKFNITKPQAPLSASSDVLLIPSEPVIFNAVARAMSERGEDGGIVSNEMYSIYRQSLSDAIALESGRYIEESEWVVY